MGGLVRIIDNITKVETEKDVDLLLGGGAGAVGANAMKITNLPLSIADTEYSHSLEDNLKQVLITNRMNANIKLAFIVNESGSNYFTIPKGCTLSMTDLDLDGKILYMQANTSSVVEIMEFYVI